jgi:hypothetical protein
MHGDRRTGEALAVIGLGRVALRKTSDRFELIKLLVTIGGFGFPLAPKMGGSSPTTRPLAACEFLVRYANHRDREERRNSVDIGRGHFALKDYPLDRSFQTARSFADGDDGSGGDIAIPIKLSITLASANSPASVGGKSALKTGRI